MKIWVLSVVIFIFSFTLFPLALVAKELKVGYFQLFPHIEKSDHYAPSPRGPLVKYMEKVFVHMGFTSITYMEYPLPRLLKSLESGKIDVAVALGRNSYRENVFLFPNRPFFLMRPVLMLLKNHPIDSIKTHKDIAGMIIGVYDKGFVSSFVKRANVKLSELGGDNVVERNYEMMMSGRIDAVYVPEENELIYKAKRAGFFHDVKFIRTPEETKGLYTVFNSESGAELKKMYEKALEEIELETPYSEVLEQFLEKGRF